MKGACVFLTSVVALLAFIGSVYDPTPALAKPYFEGKIITVIVDSGPGGRKDRITRTLARYLHKYVPGNPRFIVRNIPGPYGIIAAHQFLKGKPDGTTTYWVGTRSMEALAFGLPQANYDFREFVWFGGLNTGKQRMVLFTHKQVGFRTLDDLRSREISLGAPRVGHRSYVYGRIAAEVLNLKVRWVLGYSVPELWLAIGRGEVDGRWQDTGSAMVEVLHFIEKGQLKPHVALALPEKLPPINHPLFANVPSLMDFTQKEIHRDMIRKANATGNIGVAMALPPGTPRHIAQILEQSLMELGQDRQFAHDIENFVGIRPYAGVLKAETVIKGVDTYSDWTPEVLSAYRRLAKEPPK